MQKISMDAVKVDDLLKEPTNSQLVQYYVIEIYFYVT